MQTACAQARLFPPGSPRFQHPRFGRQIQCDHPLVIVSRDENDQRVPIGSTRAAHLVLADQAAPKMAQPIGQFGLFTLMYDGPGPTAVGPRERDQAIPVLGISGARRRYERQPVAVERRPRVVIGYLHGTHFNPPARRVRNPDDELPPVAGNVVVVGDGVWMFVPGHLGSRKRPRGGPPFPGHESELVEAVAHEASRVTVLDPARTARQMPGRRATAAVSIVWVPREAGKVADS